MTNQPASAIQITALKPEEKREAANLIARAMATNPNHMAILKAANAQTIAAQQRMFEYVVNTPTNTLIVARADGQLVGVMGYTSSAHCQLRPGQLLGILPGMAQALGRRLLPVLQWRMNWKRHDYPQPHIHFGPLAVDPQHQGKGIGKALLGYFCRYVDQLPAKAYLETDKAENVSLYEQFGFRVIAEDTLFDVPNWFMVREPLRKIHVHGRGVERNDHLN